MTARSMKPTKLVLEQCACRIGESLLGVFQDFVVGKGILEMGRNILEALGEVYFSLALLDTCGVQGILLVTDQCIPDDAAEKGVQDARPSNRKAIEVMTVSVGNI